MIRTASCLLLVLAALGCGHRGAAPAARADCDDVAIHLVQLAERDNGGNAGPVRGDLRAELEGRCLGDRWSPERRACLIEAANQEATLDCPLH